MSQIENRLRNMEYRCQEAAGEIERLLDSNAGLWDQNKRLFDSNKQLLDSNKQLLDSNKQLRDKNKRLRRLLERVLEAIGSSPPPILEIERELGSDE